MSIDAVAPILDAIAWPIAVAAAAFALKEPLKKFIPNLLGRATKISFGDFRIEFSPAKELVNPWATELVDAHALVSADEFSSDATIELTRQLAQPTASDFAIIDLGSGHEWLTSRLFIFAVVLGQVGGLKTFVFVERREGVARSFIGIASPEAVRRRLAAAFPWLEASLLRSRAAVDIDPTTTLQAMDLRTIASRAQWEITEIVQRYVAGLQQGQPPDEGWQEQWEDFEDGRGEKRWERTSWLDGPSLRRVLGDALGSSFCIMAPDTTRSEKALGILRHKARFVALLDQGERFLELVDRSEAAERLIEEVLDRFAEAKHQ